MKSHHKVSHCQPSRQKCSKCAVQHLPKLAAASNCLLFSTETEGDHTPDLSLIRVRLEVSVIRQKTVIAPHEEELADLKHERELGLSNL